MAAIKLKKREPSPSRIFIVDDHPVFRRGICALIDSQPDLVVCGEAETVKEALELIDVKKPDVAIIDLTLKIGDGLEIVKALKVRHPGIHSLVLSMHDEAVYAERSFRAGAKGYVGKQQADEAVLVAIHAVLAGETYMSDELKEGLAMRFASGQPTATMSPVETLSDRELQVFGLIGRGLTTRKIADELSVSIKTVESHVEHIKQKLNLRSGSSLHQRAFHWAESGDME